MSNILNEYRTPMQYAGHEVFVWAHTFEICLLSQHDLQRTHLSGVLECSECGAVADEPEQPVTISE